MIKANLKNNLQTSVIIGTYNGEQFIDEQLKSILRQSHLPNEIIFTDDCSSDGTRIILDKFETLLNEREIHVKKIYREKNVGYIANFLQAISLATKDIIFLCDQDDVWKPNKIEATLQFFEEESACIALHSNTEIIDSRGNIIKRNVQEYKNRKKLVSVQEFVKKINYPGMALAFRKEPIYTNIQQFKIDKLPTHDWYIAFLACMLGGFYTTSNTYTSRRYTGKNVALNISEKSTVPERIKGIRLYLDCYNLVRKIEQKSDKSQLGINIDMYIKNSYRRITYLEKENILACLKNIKNIKYYPSAKSYIKDIILLSKRKNK